MINNFFKRESWKRSIFIHLDLLISLLLTLILYSFIVFFHDNFLFKDYEFFAMIFIAIFSVNFTVFALSKFLLENYPKIKESRIKKNIDMIFKTPIKISLIGLITSTVFYILDQKNLTSFNFIIYFLFFYSIISSYYVFKFLYTISIRRGNS